MSNQIPADFVKPDHSRASAWVRSEQADWADIVGGRWRAVDLRALSEWCIEAAVFLEQQAAARLKAQENVPLVKSVEVITPQGTKRNRRFF